MNTPICTSCNGSGKRLCHDCEGTGRAMSAPSIEASPTPSHPASPGLPESVRQAIQIAVERQELHLRLAGYGITAPMRETFLNTITAALTPLWPSADATPSPAAGLPTVGTDEDRIGGFRITPEGLKMNGPLPPTKAETAGYLAEERADLLAALAAARAEVEAAKEQRRVVHEDTLRTITDLRAQLATAKEEVAVITKDRDEWKAIAERLDAKCLHEQEDHNKTVDRLIALRSDLAKANAAVEEAKELRDAALKEVQWFQDKCREAGVSTLDIVTTITGLRAQLTAQQSVPPAGSEPDDTVGTLLRMPANLHPMTRKLVKNFAASLAEKLFKAEQKYGYSDGWVEPEWVESGECAAKLLEHIQKGDPHDVAAYCAFLWWHNASTTPASVPPEARAVANKIACHFVGNNDISLDEGRAYVEEALRTCFPPGEGEGWAKAAVAEIFATGRVQNLYPGAPLSTADKLKDIILKHAPARPTAAREDTARLVQALTEIAEAVANGEPISMLWAKTALQEHAAMQQGGKTA